MDYFVHSTIVSPLTRIRQERKLPTGGEVIAKIGQVVSPVQVVARTPSRMEFQVVPVCKMLRMTPDELIENLLVSKGAPVEAGTPIVKKRGFGRREFVSPVDGTLYEVVNGRLVFQKVIEFLELRALAKARVVNRISNQGVVLEINGSRIQALWDSGKEGFGPILVASETAFGSIKVDRSGDDISHQILVSGKITNAEALDEVERAGIGGLIVGSISANLLPKALSVNYPIFITDGFGQQGMATPIFKLLQQSETRDVALFSRPNNQPEVRPEIIIPLDAIPGEELPPAGQPLKIGQVVRVLRPPFNNQYGVVVKIYNRSQPTSIDTRAYCADVKLSDGKVVLLPIVNLDALV